VAIGRGLPWPCPRGTNQWHAQNPWGLVRAAFVGGHARLRICRGDVFWIGPDDSRGAVPSYSHPHVVVQDDVFNHSRITTVIVCALTSNLHLANEPGNVLLDVGEGDLPKQSVAVVSQVSSLSDSRVEQILAGLRFQQASFFGQ
jgi:mRNA interferase MazF